jgi:hypothetical protein
MGQKPYSMLKKEYEFGAMLTQKLESDWENAKNA